ncbi:MAG: hypothetical protein LUE92_11680 [Clostridiales bacterium]|nr:hypothetical protein [Clostridiales bacterium]
MRHKILPILLACMILYCLAFPQRMAESVAGGLMLWYRSILPTLLPFCIFSSVIVQSGIYDRFFERMYPLFRIIYPVRSPLIYPLAAGFLFGFPLGGKICADLYHTGKISSKEAEAVTCISNHFGPAFLYNYLYRNLFQNELPAFAVFAACYLPPLLLGRIRLHRLYHGYGKRSDRAGSPAEEIKKPAPGSPLNIKILDAGISDSFTTMIKLAGYIILSALLADIILQIPLKNQLIKSLSIGIIEITNGLSRVEMLTAGTVKKSMLAIGIVNLGGISGLCQTWSVMKGTGFRIRRYLLFKLLCSLIGILLIRLALELC